jgi:hypothetical protein
MARTHVGAATRLLGIVAMACLGCWSRSTVVITIENRTDGAIRGVRISGEDVSNELAEVRSRETKQMSLKAHHESDLVLAFTDSSGRSCTRQLGVYVEQGIGGRIDVAIEACDRVAVEPHLRVR